RTGDYVAWVPLAPREVYYGHGNYGRNSVNITNVNITQVNVTNVYRNANVTNGVTVVRQTTFVTGRTADVPQNVVMNIREDFSRRRNIVVGRPPIKPVQTSYIPVERHIPEAKRPPDVVRKIDLKELKRTRPMVNKPDQSALRPQQKPRPLEVRKVETQTPRNDRVKERRQIPPAERGLKMQTSTPPASVTKPPVRPGTEKKQLPPPVKERQQTPPPAKERRQAPPPVKERPQATPPATERQKDAPPARERQQAAPPVKERKPAPPPEKERQKATPPVRERKTPIRPEMKKEQTPPPEKDGRKTPPPHDNVSHENPKGGGERGGERGIR
ncbi:MAG: hypothetical protein HW377_1561, partial [Actinobacteria bacterium]|nr:hypothetical protein [Actinomycetota bacterium]